MAAVAVGPGVSRPSPGPGVGPGSVEGADALFVALSAGFTALSHPLLYVKLLVQVRLGSGPSLPHREWHRWALGREPGGGRPWSPRGKGLA